MSALALFSELSDRGITIRTNGPDVVVSPKNALTPDLVTRIKKDKSELLDSLQSIQEKAGKDWREVSRSPESLKAFANMMAIEDMRLNGVAPDHYTSTTTCKHCGPVPIWDGCPPDVHGCPWCFNRHQDLPIPGVT